MSKKQSILIVDDSRESLLITGHALEQLNVEVIQATSGEEALRLCRENDFAAAVLDVQMPGMDGYKLAERFRFERRARHLPIIFVSGGCSDEFHVFKGYESGAVDFITKPFNPIVLRAKLKVFLEQDGRRQELVEQKENSDRVLRERTAQLELEVKGREELNARLASELAFNTSIFNSTATLIMVLDGGRRILRFNRACERICGMPAEDAVGKKFEEVFIQEQDRDIAPMIINMKKIRQKQVAGELGFVDGDGKRHLIFWSFTSLGHGEETEGADNLVTAVGVDLSMQKEAEDATRLALIELNQIFETTSIGECLIDTELHVLKANRAFCEMFEMDVDALLRCQCKDSIACGRCGSPECLVGQVLEGEKQVDAELRRMKQDGQELYLHISILPFRNQQAKVTGVLCRFTDITQIKRHERERGDIQARAFTQSKLASIGELAAGVAHEINNPATFISGNAQLIESFLPLITTCLNQVPPGSPDAERLEFIAAEMPLSIKRIRSGVERISKIVNNLKSFSRKEDATGERKPVDVHQVIETSLELCHNRLKYSVEVAKQFRCAPAVVSGDRNKLEQVFVNLFMNAADALEGREGSALTISTRREGGGCVITIHDNGPGIDSKILEKIWNPFFTTKPTGKGTGLGLSISKGIVESHNGEISAVNDADGGAAFLITLPLEKNVQTERKEQGNDV